jgi:flavodoxin/NAD-dependent dihydropyrimidine dehydrogenase PreA subunit
LKTLIIYFSQTGNTCKVAGCIRDGIVAVTGQCDLTKLSDVDTGSLANYDLVGLGCPTHYWKAPFNVCDFIEKLPELKDRQWFVFCTHGATIGNTFPSMVERLKIKGIIVIGYHHTYADAKLPFYPYPVLTTGHPDSLDLEAARTFGREIVSRSQRVADGDLSIIPEPEPVPEEWTREAKTFNLKLLERIAPRLSINMDKCTRCHACEDNCPVKGIDVEADPPRVQNPCIYCFHCWGVCPTLAIEANWDLWASFAHENYVRYRRELDKAVACDEFRWLIDPDSLDFKDSFFKQRERELKGAKPRNS